jgi:hypothetical protein
MTGEVKNNFEKGNLLLFENAAPTYTWRLRGGRKKKREEKKTLQEGRWNPAVIQAGNLPNTITVLSLLRLTR